MAKLLTRVTGQPDSDKYDCFYVYLTEKQYSRIRHMQSRLAKDNLTEVRAHPISDHCWCSEIELFAELNDTELERKWEQVSASGDFPLELPDDFEFPEDLREHPSRTLHLTEVVCYTDMTYWTVISRKDLLADLETQPLYVKQLEQLMPKKKIIRANLSALTRQEWSGLVEVPDDWDQEVCNHLVRGQIYDEVPAEDFMDDIDFWEKGDGCYADMSPSIGDNEEPMFRLIDDDEILSLERLDA